LPLNVSLDFAAKQGNKVSPTLHPQRDTFLKERNDFNLVKGVGSFQEGGTVPLF
jgi:hypothetical protein